MRGASLSITCFIPRKEYRFIDAQHHVPVGGLEGITTESTLTILNTDLHSIEDWKETPQLHLQSTVWNVPIGDCIYTSERDIGASIRAAKRNEEEKQEAQILQYRAGVCIGSISHTEFIKRHWDQQVAEIAQRGIQSRIILAASGGILPQVIYIRYRRGDLLPFFGIQEELRPGMVKKVNNG